MIAELADFWGKTALVSPPVGVTNETEMFRGHFSLGACLGVSAFSLFTEKRDIMSDKEYPVTGGGPSEGKPDGVAASPATDNAENVSGRHGGGESQGGAYPNPHSGKAPTNSGFMGHGGQTEIEYHGNQSANGGAGNAAAGTGSASPERTNAPLGTGPEWQPHRVSSAGASFEVIETSGVAQAELTGNVGNKPAGPGSDQ